MALQQVYMGKESDKRCGRLASSLTEFPRLTLSGRFDMRSVGSSVLNGGAYGIEASAVTTVVLSAALVLCLLFSRKISAAAHKNVPA